MCNYPDTSSRILGTVDCTAFSTPGKVKSKNIIHVIDTAGLACTITQSKTKVRIVACAVEVSGCAAELRACDAHHIVYTGLLEEQSVNPSHLSRRRHVQRKKMMLGALARP